MQDDHMRKLECLAKRGDSDAHIELSKEYIRRGRCEDCGKTPAGPVKAMTRYSWDGVGKNPNGDLFLCEECTHQYIDEWEERWAEYYSGLL